MLFSLVYGAQYKNFISTPCRWTQDKNLRELKVLVYRKIYFIEWKVLLFTRSLGALRALTSRLQPFGPALGPSGLLDNVLHALRALRPCDPRISAMME